MHRTNISEPPPAGYNTSRGHLVSAFLLSDPSQPFIKEGKENEEVERQIQRLISVPRDTKFSGFNLLLLAPQVSKVPVCSLQSSSSPSISFDALLVTNGGAGGRITFRELTKEEQRCGGLSNGVDGKGGCKWPKIVQGTTFLNALLSEWDISETELTNRLFDILAYVAHPSSRAPPGS